MNLLIVEDNPAQLSLLKAHLAAVPHVKITDCVTSAKEYINALTVNNEINAVMLDEELSGNMNGLEACGLLQIRGIKVPTLLMTGHVPSASHAADLGIIDTLEKPFTASRLKTALEKLRHHLHYQHYLASGGVFVPVISEHIVQLLPDDIYFIESINRTIFVHTQKGIYETKVPLKLYEEYLSSFEFVLTHRSCLVNLQKIKRIDLDTIHFRDYSRTAIILEDKAGDIMRLWQATCSKAEFF
ncbi:LytTR family DNA-binding domain-containing protein [Paenibacillus sp. MMS20-IR301]|uniref:LytR/AlgR family response regulator transcription factor n=1 Tax=Paenibacillus sp. MMS20-IR301 TaxID=2895946 RepID=UPI0028E962A6|nr:LytTR family DNA-binding domain-containing protein [Paenibacillus sp. MMS20-IR301]WNS43414.1 LytTR family DNA-binding domain-containing protein [Paenibacillus sp. MMS20-IR301]